MDNDTNAPVIVPKTRRLESLRPKQLRFFVAYLKCGSQTEAYMKVYRMRNRVQACSSASHLIGKFKDIKKLLYEVNGLGEKDMIAAIKGALGANKTTLTKTGMVVNLGPDHYARLKAVELRNKSLGEGFADSGTGKGNTLNVLIVKDKDKGVFQVGEENV